MTTLQYCCWITKGLVAAFLLLGLLLVIRDLGGAVFASDETAKLELLAQTWFSVSAGTLHSTGEAIRHMLGLHAQERFQDIILAWPTAYVMFGISVFFMAFYVIFRWFARE